MISGKKKETREFFGIEELDESQKKAFMSIIGMRGKVHQGYGNQSFMLKTINCLDYYMRVNMDSDISKLEYKDLYFHNSSFDVVELTIDNPCIEMDPDDRNHRIISGYCKNKSCYAVINLINADVLPCFVEGTYVEAQIIAYPYGKIRKYDDEDEYKKSVLNDSEVHNHMKTYIPTGYVDKFVAPLKEYTEGPDTVFLMGVVTSIKRNTSELFAEKVYNQATIHTDMGRISIIFTDDQLSDGGKEPLVSGSIIAGNFWLEGDPAIYKHESYSLRRLDVLMLLQNTIELGDAERLRKVLAPEVVYSTVNSDEEYKGIDAVIDRFNYVLQNMEATPFAYLGEVKRKKRKAPKKDNKPGFCRRTKCVVIAYNDPRNHEAVAFINRNEQHLIKRITIENSSNYIYDVISSQERRWYER